MAKHRWDEHCADGSGVLGKGQVCLQGGGCYLGGCFCRYYESKDMCETSWSGCAVHGSSCSRALGKAVVAVREVAAGKIGARG